MKVRHASRGFTIVELLIVIVIIGILATIVIVAYNGITTKARQVTLQSDLSNSRTKLEVANATDGQYPLVATVNANKSNYLAQSKGNTLTYSTNPNQNTYCVSALGSDNIMYVISNLAGPYKGNCTGTNNEVATEGNGTPPPPVSPAIQTVTTATCPATMTKAQDARDSHTYWIKKIGTLCWMMTNLGYAGGGTNTYGDAISTATLTNGTGDGATVYTAARYYIVPSTTNYTTEPADPSTSTGGTGQYGYLYNWCAAMGCQTGTSACANAITDNWNHNISICPLGWRLPVGNGNEFTALNTAANSGSTTSDAGLIGVGWLGQRGGIWVNGFSNQGTSGRYWSSSQNSATGAYDLDFDSTSVGPAGNGYKYGGYAVRCVAV